MSRSTWRLVVAAGRWMASNHRVTVYEEVDGTRIVTDLRYDEDRF